MSFADKIIIGRIVLFIIWSIVMIWVGFAFGKDWMK